MGADGHHPQHPQAVQGVNGNGLMAGSRIDFTKAANG